MIISSVGILESDIVSMLSRYMEQSSSENNPNVVVINQMTWAVLRRHLKTFLDTTWVDGYQLIVFRHSTLEQVDEMIIIDLVG